MKGIRDLYEASHLSIAGEDIVVEAEQFSKQVLKERLSGNCFDSHEAKLWESLFKAFLVEAE
ncbi:unnamed protein product [Lupinus luteus]|uniref:Uncharacterized protein n=1 Tax=Lupinus luteus TaxID=3873 RepID=A0AAV1WJP6_LUPLU